MFINRMKCTTLVYFLIIIVEASKLQYYRQNQEKRTPRFYKIFERDREIYVQNNDNLNGHKALLNLLEIIKDGNTDEIGRFEKKRVAKNKPFKTKSADVQYHNRLPQTITDIKEHKELSANENYDVKNLKAQLNFLRTKAGNKLPACYRNLDETQLDAMPSEVRSVVGKSLLRAIAPPLHPLLHEDPWKIKLSKKKNYTFEKYPCPYFPHKSIWDSWTYKHPIYIDDCPGELVNINGVCSNTPPHRRGQEDTEDTLLNIRLAKKSLDMAGLHFD